MISSVTIRREEEGGEAVAVLVGEADTADAGAIATIHVDAWRAAYAGILEDRVLLALRRPRLSFFYARRIAAGGVLVARRGSAVIGFASAGINRGPFGAGEIETLYVGPDWQGQGVGRALLRNAAAHLISRHCASAYLWVLAANPSRFFYEHLGGSLVGHGITRVGGDAVPQLAYRWDPIDRLIDARPIARRRGPD